MYANNTKFSFSYGEVFENLLYSTFIYWPVPFSVWLYRGKSFNTTFRNRNFKAWKFMNKNKVWNQALKFLGPKCDLTTLWIPPYTIDLCLPILCYQVITWLSTNWLSFPTLQYWEITYLIPSSCSRCHAMCSLFHHSCSQRLLQ